MQIFIKLYKPVIRLIKQCIKFYKLVLYAYKSIIRVLSNAYVMMNVLKYLIIFSDKPHQLFFNRKKTSQISF